MYLKLILVLGVVGAAGGAYAYHQVTVAKLENAVIQLEANNRTLKENNNVLQAAAENNATKVMYYRQRPKTMRRRSRN